ncbi:MAG: class I SAM-dependent methyltransferase, partial [Halobacteriota archaeon]
ERHDVDVEIHGAGAGELPFDDGEVDSVVCSIVLCTVPDPVAAVDEVGRVLRPGGELRFMEHVHADGTVGAVQSLVNPVWKRCAGNCHLDRDTVELLRQHPGLSLVEVEDTGASAALVRPFVRGTAVR